MTGASKGGSKYAFEERPQYKDGGKSYQVFMTSRYVTC